jgi:hypothetical protein
MIELFGRFIRWFVRFIGGSTLFRLVLLSLTLVSVGSGLIAVVGHIHPDWLPTTIVYAVLIGWLLGRSKLPGWGSGLVAIGIGLLWLILSVGQMSIPIDILLPALPPILKQIILRIPPEVGPLLVAWATFTQSLGGLTIRLMLWLRNAGTSTLIIDPVITSLVWGLALWLVSTWAAWWVRRRETLGVGLLPATIMLVYNIYYTNSKNGLLWLVLTGGGWILLQAMDSYVKGRRHWQEQRMDQTEIEPLLAGVTILLASGLMLAGGLIPSVSIQKLSDTFQHIFQTEQNKNLAESLGLQQTPAVFIHTGSGGIGLSDTHAIGPGPQLSQEVLMYVTVEGYQPPPPPDVTIHTNVAQPDVSYYWRSQTYEVYNGHVWISNTAQTQELAANSPYHPSLTTLPKNFQLVIQHVERLQPMDGALFVTGDLLSTDQLSFAAWRAPGDLIDARANANTFTAESRIQYVSVDQLRTAGNTYPESVHNYLNLPDDLPERVRDLAVRLTINQPTPYDQVMAIQNYLRQFPYSLQVPGAPTNRDVADYFLFDLQKGYCDYFATAMAVMVRVTGIPSRLVTGFSSGTFDYNAHRFVVVQANAHSWVEVYFPGIGWVEFEPTSNLPPFPRPGETASQNNLAVDIQKPVPVTGSGITQINWSALRQPLRILEWILTSLAVCMLLWLLLPFESWLLYLRPADQAITAIHHRLYLQGHAWGVAANATRTPHEFAEAFSIRLDRFTGNQRLAPTVTALHMDVIWLTDLYARLLFSLHPPTRAEHHQAVRNWMRIRKGLRKIRYS